MNVEEFDPIKYAWNLYLEESRLIEQTIEKSLVRGDCGVLVLRDRHQALIRAEVNEEVPYGQVWIKREE